MHKLRCLHLSAAALAFAALVGMEARSAELEGALPVSASFGRTGSVTSKFGAKPCFLSSLRINRSAACVSRRR
jgi:hypothetical protein